MPGYWNEEHINDVVAGTSNSSADPPDSGSDTAPCDRVGPRALYCMPPCLDTDVGRGLYRQRRETIEPIFGHTKHNPQVHPVSPPWPVTGPHRRAAVDDHPQPRQAPPLPVSRRLTPPPTHTARPISPPALPNPSTDDPRRRILSTRQPLAIGVVQSQSAQITKAVAPRDGRFPRKRGKARPSRHDLSPEQGKESRGDAALPDPIKRKLGCASLGPARG